MNIKLSLLLLVLTIPFVALCRSKKVKMLKTGDVAPSFSLPDENGKMRSLGEFKNKKVVLYFYPQDGTANCTKEACQLRDAFGQYKKNNITILGISFDSVKSHQEFKSKNSLPFTLLSDSKKKVAKLYNSNKSLLGNFYPDRTTILIDEAGKIVKILENVNVQTHSDEILKAFGVTNKK